MTPYDLIIKKQSGGELNRNEIAYLIGGFTDGSIADYQMSAFLMAVYFKGMTDEETYHFMRAMIESGDTIDTADIAGIKLDKHSTGGVGDKVTLVLGPLVAAAGVPIPMISGRGLGHTGGTLDKLESIPGFDVNLPIEKFLRQVRDIGISIIGQSGEIVPADGKMYALRDVTGTVGSIPLICASIMSKKIAEGIDALVLDIKTGGGAFIPEIERSWELAVKLTTIGKRAGLSVTAVVTDMSQPLGYQVGNRLEVEESILCLKGEGPSDVMEVVFALGAEMLVLGGISDSADRAREKLQSLIDDGSAFEKFIDMVDAQGGDTGYLENPALLPPAMHAAEIKALDEGFIVELDAYKIGTASVTLGAGRIGKEDKIDFTAGITLMRKIGDEIKPGDVLAIAYTNDEGKLDSAVELIESAYRTGGIIPDEIQLTGEIIR